VFCQKSHAISNLRIWLAQVSNPCLPANSQFARQATVRQAFASISNAVFGVLLKAGSGLAVHNFKAAKNFGLSTSVRIPNGSCRVLPFAQPNRLILPACRPPRLAIEGTTGSPDAAE
jgi:hypothetical protein